MESNKKVKRKSPSQSVVFEISDNDVSSEHSDSDCTEPQAKIIKTQSDFVNSVVLAISKLENEKNLEANLSKHSEETDSKIIKNEVKNVHVENSKPSCDVQPTIIQDSVEIEAKPSKVHEAGLGKELEAELGKILEAEPSKELEAEPSKELEAEPSKELEAELSKELEVDTSKELEEGEVDENSSSARVPSDSTKLSESEQCLRITFSNENMSDLYKFKFQRFIKSFIELEIVNEDKLTIDIKRDSLLDSSEWIIVDEITAVDNAKEDTVEEKLSSPLSVIPEKGPKKKRKKTKKEKNLFVLDTTPQNETENNMCAKYSSKFQIEIHEDVEEEVVKVSTQTCFNCDGSHSLRDCPLPKDYSKINLKRQKFKTQRQTSRYHLEEDQKFSHLAPGNISDRLREALGLKKNQLPPYIYQMRVMGYPPGWLEEAKFIYSDLEMFDFEGKNVEQNNSEKTQGLNSEKIIDYPGFNVPMEKHVKDEFRQFRVPPYSEMYSKKLMLEYFAKQFVSKSDSNSDLDNTVKEGAKKDLRCEIKKPILEAVLEIKETKIGVPSPSLPDLEQKKQNLLAELQDSSNSNLKSEEKTSEAPERVLEPNVLDNPEGTPFNDSLQIDIESAAHSSSCLISPPLNSSVNSVKDSSFGTPILRSNSSFSRLPKAENFMKDVSPVINFENLPNSTGKYEQMTNVLQKVRDKMKHLQNCKS